MTNSLLHIRTLGQQLWLDNLSRTLLRDGHLSTLIANDGLTGVTTNPSIFHKSIAAGRYYADDLNALKQQSLSPEARYEQLVIPDVQAACDLLAPVYQASQGGAGYVSLEVSPALAHDAAGTVSHGLRLAQAVQRDNLLIKVPATTAGVQAIEALIAAGISVNVTLLFSLAQVEAVAAAYCRGLQHFSAQGGDVSRIFSVASLFLSRVDTLVDGLIRDSHATLRGHTAVSTAKLAYQAYRERFEGQEFAALRALGARPQYLLWASTGTKNAAYSDLLYVEPVIGADTINTLPDATLAALRDHGRAQLTLESGVAEAQSQYAQLRDLGIDLETLAQQLQQEGLQQFVTAFDALLELCA